MRALAAAHDQHGLIRPHGVRGPEYHGRGENRVYKEICQIGDELKTLGELTRRLPIPTIGIGSGPDCDGQVLVFHDLLGWTPGPRLTFVRSYADLSGEIHRALIRFKDDVEQERFPSAEESF